MATIDTDGRPVVQRGGIQYVVDAYRSDKGLPGEHRLCLLVGRTGGEKYVRVEDEVFVDPLAKFWWQAFCGKSALQTPVCLILLLEA